MSEWIDGPPKNDGLYAVVWLAGVSAVVRRKDSKVTTPSGTQYHPPATDIVRHCRLPEIPTPLPLPRRFRARHHGEDVVGVMLPRHESASTLTTYFWRSQKNDGWLGYDQYHHFTDTVWIDPEGESEP